MFWLPVCLLFLSVVSAGIIFMRTNASIIFYGGQSKLTQVSSTTLSLQGSLQVTGLMISGLSVVPEGVCPTIITMSSSYSKADHFAFQNHLRHLLGLDPKVFFYKIKTLKVPGTFRYGSSVYSPFHNRFSTTTYCYLI